MFTSALAVLCSLAALSRAAPALVARTVSAPNTGALVNDTNILNYALTLEHIENAFYKQGLAQFDAQAFEDAGFEPSVRGRFEQISSHEATHIAFLSAALGSHAVEPCNYTYPYTDPMSFAALSMTFEGVGAGAYLGASQFIEDRESLLSSVSIGETEARQNAWVTSAVLKEQPWDGPFATPLTFSGAYSLAVGFITECPESNPPLPVTPYPALNVTDSSPRHGQSIALSWEAKTNDAVKFAWYSGLNTTFTPISGGTTVVPPAVLGTVYGGVVTNASTVANVTMVSGLAVFSFPFSSYDTSPNA